MRFFMPPQPPDMPTAVDASMSNQYNSCEAKFGWRYVWHIKPRAIEKPLSFGGALHEGWANIYRQLRKEPGKYPDIDQSITAFLEYVEKDGSADTLNEDKVRTLTQGARALEDYIEHYATDPQFIPREIEMGFALEIPGNKSVVYCGKIDAIGEWTSQQRTSGLEHKHTTRFGDMYFKQYTPDMQIDGYSWALSEYYEDFLSLVVNVSVIHGVTKKNPQGETLFHRRHFQRARRTLDEFKLDLNDTIDRMARSYAHGDFLRNKQHCFAWYRECPYRILCTSPSEAFVRRRIEVDYEVNPWHPYKELVEGKAKEVEDE